MKVGDDVRIDFAGTVTSVESEHITIKAAEGGAVWCVSWIASIPSGAIIERLTASQYSERSNIPMFDRILLAMFCVCIVIAIAIAIIAIAKT